MRVPPPPADAPAAPRIPYAFARAHGVLAWRDEGERVVVLLRPGASVDALTEVRRVLDRAIVTRAVDAETFAAELAKAYNQAGAAVAMSESLANEADLARLLQEMPASEDLLDAGAQAPVIRMINALLLEALRERASDLHFEPYEARAAVRFRIDGMLRDAIEPPRALHAALVSRVKIMAGLDIAEKRLPQDGRIALKLGGRQVDVRVSTLPTGAGERVVLRLLDQQAARLDLGALGMSDDTLRAVDALIREPHGILLVTGPTGSGKTTTLYTALSRINTPDRKIITVEDPVEYQLEGINQMQVKPGIGLDFAGALRSIVRQDPDVIMIGEMRDLETCRIAIQSALTGHLVLSTLHTNSAAGGLTRLLDMGVEDYLLASTVNAIVAQRLVRCLDPDAAEAYEPLPEMVEELGLDKLTDERPLRLYRPRPTSENPSGFYGRLAIIEQLTMNDALRRLLMQHADASDIERAARQSGMRTMYEDGLRKALAGLTTIEEVLRVTQEA